MRTIHRSAARSVCVAVALLLEACATSTPSASPPARAGSEAHERIRYYTDRIAEHPRVYATYLGLALAYLDKARETSDPKWVTKAQAATQTSLDIMVSLEGYKTMATIANFSHRFADALTWGLKAKEILTNYVTDGGTIAILVEAHMGLGQYDEARKLLPPDGTQPADFYTAAAMGHWRVWVSQQQRDEAAEAFETAVRFALAQDVRELATWARVMAGGVYLDAGQLERARPYLKAAEAIGPTYRELRIHLAEFAVAEGRPGDALAAYEALLFERSDAELHRRAFLLARAAGDETRAQDHFQAAERMLLRVVDARQGYTLEELARLYLDAGVKLDRALELATKNLDIKRDRSAVETLEAARRATGRSEVVAPPRLK